MPSPSRPAPNRSATSPLRLLQAGLGGWGRSWAEIVAAAAGVTAVGRIDLDPAALAALADHAEVPGFASLEGALEAAPADALLISAGLGAHAPLAQAALEAGLHVLVEKPFAPTLAVARALVERAAARERVLMVSQNYRFHSAPRKVRALLDEGALGALGTVRIDFRRRFPPPADAPYRRGLQPLLLDMFVHHADLLRFVLGLEPRTVRCHAWNPPWSGFRDPASAAMTVTFEGGLVAAWRGSWDSTADPTPWAGLWTIEGERGAIEWTSRDDLGARYNRVALDLLDGDRTDFRLPDVPQRDRAGSLSAFAEAVRTGAEPTSSGRDNLGTLALCLAAIRSAEEGREVRLDAEV